MNKTFLSKTQIDKFNVVFEFCTSAGKNVIQIKLYRGDKSTVLAIKSSFLCSKVQFIKS